MQSSNEVGVVFNKIEVVESKNAKIIYVTLTDDLEFEVKLPPTCPFVTSLVIMMQN